MKEEIKKYVEEYYDDYYPDQEEGQYTGDAESLAYAFANHKKVTGKQEEIKKIIDKMIEDGELVTDTVEWVNPENEQHTIYVGIITLPSFVETEDAGRNVRPSQHSWGLGYPANYEWFESFVDFQNSLIKEMESDPNIDDKNDPVSIEEVKKWEKWDDVVCHDIL